MSAKSMDALRSILKYMSKGPGFDTILTGVKVVSGGSGRCLCEMKVNEHHLNRGGSLHGGMTATLVDCISTMALMTTGEGNPGVSVDMSVSYMKACKPGSEILIDADTLKVGKTLAFLTVDLKLKDTGDLIAQGKHTKFVGS